MFDSERTVAVTFNGEIYNYRTLKRQLETEGYVFRTSSDTEVLIHGYRKWGLPSMLSRIEGMFAFALFDLPESRMYLARDPYGQKPLYYTVQAGGRFAFASSLKAVTALDWVSQQPDPAGLELGLLLRFIPAPWTCYQDVRKLRPGHYLSYNRHGATESRYWDDSCFRPSAEKIISKNEVLAALIGAVQDSLVSDVSVALLLSSGIDSSLIAGILRECGRTDITAVSVGFREKSYDESLMARRTATAVGLRHEVVFLEAADVPGRIGILFEAMDEPLGDPSLLPTLLLSESVRRFTKVALGGDGGDELFGGYPTFQALRYLPLLNGRFQAFCLKKCTPFLKVNYERYSMRYKVRRLIRGLGRDSNSVFLHWLFTMDTSELECILQEKSGRAAKTLESMTGVGDSRDKVWLMSQQYLRFFLPGVLMKVDTASMHFGLEVRAPLLQPEVVRTALQLPPQMKTGHGQTKYVLRQILRGMGLENQARLPKQGFNVPLSQWIRGCLKGFAADILSREKLSAAGFFDPTAVSRLWAGHQSGAEDNFDALWSILVTQNFLYRNLVN